MNDPLSKKCGRVITLNQNGLEEDEEREDLESGTEGEESPPHLEFTDGSCSESHLSHDSPRNCLSPCEGLQQSTSLTRQDVLTVPDRDKLAEELFVISKTRLDGSKAYDIRCNQSFNVKSPSAVESSTDFALDIHREEVDMEVSSGDEEDLLHQKNLMDEKRRIEENIQAIMKEFERKRFLEKAGDAEDVASYANQKPNHVSTTSEVAMARKVDSLSRSIEKNTGVHCNVEFMHDPLRLANSEKVHHSTLRCWSLTEKSCSREGEKDGMECELPSSSVEVPPIPTYEEIDQCIYEVESKKKAVSLMCFCRGNNLDCSDTRCDNRAMFTECPKNCLGKGKDCRNRRFAKKEYAAVQAFYTGPSKGFGVQALAPIKNSGETLHFVSRLDGTVVFRDVESDNRPTISALILLYHGWRTSNNNASGSMRRQSVSNDTEYNISSHPFYDISNYSLCYEGTSAERKQMNFTFNPSLVSVAHSQESKNTLQWDPRGQFIIEYVGEVVSTEEFAKRLKRYGRDPSHTHHYMFEIGSMIIDATKKGNCSRFMNHSCEPNAVCEKWYVPKTPGTIDRIGFFAKRDIESGEEITFDYQFENYGREAQRCCCGTSSCSGWIGKPPEMPNEDMVNNELESPSDESEGSLDVDMKLAERVVLHHKKLHRCSTYDRVTIEEIERKLCRVLRVGCRNRTHVLGWIKLMTEMALMRKDADVLKSMCRIVDALCSVDSSLQHIFVANGLSNIFKSWLRTSNSETLTREELDLKHCIIRCLLTMQTCADAINARTPELLAMVTDLATMSTPEVLPVRDVMDSVVHHIVCEVEKYDPKLFQESLEVRFERVRNAAIRLQVVLQRHVNFRIPKKKPNAMSMSPGNDQLLADDTCRVFSRGGDGALFRFHDRDRLIGRTDTIFRRSSFGIGNGRPRLRISRLSQDCRPQKRVRSGSSERDENCVIRCRIGPTMSQTILATECSPSLKRNRPIIDDKPIIVTTVRPNWPPPPLPAAVPPPPQQMLSPTPIMVPPPPPQAQVPPVYPVPVSFCDYAPCAGLAAAFVPPYSTRTNYPRTPNGEHDPEEYREYFKSCDIATLQARMQCLLKEMTMLQSILDQKTRLVQSTTVVPLTSQLPTPKTPPPPPHKEYMWRKAVDEDGAKYYYHKETRESVWELPEGEESDPGEKTPTRMPDTSGCDNETESDNVEGKNSRGLLLRWSSMCSPQVSTSDVKSVTPMPLFHNNKVSDGLPQTSQRKRERDRRVWEKFRNDVDRKRAKKLMSEIEKVVGPVIVRYIIHREDATKKKQEWIIKQVSKEMLKRESERVDFNFTLTEKGSKRVSDYAEAFIKRKCAKEPKDMWKGYYGSP